MPTVSSLICRSLLAGDLKCSLTDPMLHRLQAGLCKHPHESRWVNTGGARGAPGEAQRAPAGRTGQCCQWQAASVRLRHLSRRVFQRRLPSLPSVCRRRRRRDRSLVHACFYRLRRAERLFTWQQAEAARAVLKPTTCHDKEPYLRNGYCPK
jgi:hypothetical protein